MPDMGFDRLSDCLGNSGIESLRHDILLVQFVIRHQTGDRTGGGQLHLFRDLYGPSLQCTLKDTGEGHHVVDLVRKIGTAGADHSCAGCFGCIRHDLRYGIGHGKKDGIRIHGRYHIGCYYIGRGDTNKDVGAFQRICKRTGSAA